LKDRRGMVKYVGRTQNPEARRLAHQKRYPDLKFKPQKSGLTYTQARGLEQFYWRRYRSNVLYNKIRPIYRKNKNRRAYLDEAKNHLRDHGW
jgi:hypothetical protein